MSNYVLGIDQGGSGSRALVLDAAGRRAGYGYQALGRLYPQPGWVEQDPLAVQHSVRGAIQQALAQAGCTPQQLLACGITSQRDTVFAWEAQTGAPIGNAITWQDLRTLPLVAEIAAWPQAEQRRARLGQWPGPYCSAMHMAWRMRHDPAFRAAAEAGNLRVSLAAGWILQALGRPNGQRLDYSLMQAMTVFDPRRRVLWDAWIEYLNLPRHALPSPGPTLQPYGELRIGSGSARALVPVLAMISDQQASLFGYDCRQPGPAVCTLGTASFVHSVVGPQPPAQGLAKVYLAWELDGQPTYTLEADTTLTGAAIRWMQERMGFLRSPAQLNQLAARVPDAGGVVFVPAFNGLGVPYEDRSARGTLLGLTLDSGPEQIARALIDAIGQQVADILDCFADEAGIRVATLRVGGGVAQSELVCQTIADLCAVPVERAADSETSVRAAALLAGLGAGLWPNVDALPPLAGPFVQFSPQIGEAARLQARARWHWAIERARGAE